MERHDIELYLTELGTELNSRGVHKPIRVMLIGGAYMLLQANASRTTDDIDFFWLEKDALQRTHNPLRECVQAITLKYGLDSDWFNYLSQLLLYDEIVIPNGKLWRRFGPLYIYIPPKKYILALKILAGRTKDIHDCAILLSQTKIKTRQQAQQLLDQYVLPGAQENHAAEIADALDELFGEPEPLAEESDSLT